MRDDHKIVIEDRPMPIDKYKNFKFNDNNGIRMSGGFANVAFLGSIVMTAIMWIMIIIFMIGK